MTYPVKSIAFACHIGINMHSLNNEGSQGNRMLPRLVNITTLPNQGENHTTKYQSHTVNAISGNSQKHGIVEYFLHKAVDLGLPVCEACQQRNSTRMMGNASFLDAILDEENDLFWDSIKIGKKETRQINGGRVTDMLLTCAVDDIGGILVAAPKVHIPRTSVIDLGWCIGLPDNSTHDDYHYNRLSSNQTARAKSLDKIDEETREELIRNRQINQGQMIFTRPSASGIYAFQAYIDVAGIGFNKISQSYPEIAFNIPIQRNLRLRALLLAVGDYILQPFGAQKSTQLPHISSVEGYVAVSQSSSAAPLSSPLNNNYIASAKSLAKIRNELEGRESISIFTFSDSVELLTVIATILNSTTPGHYFQRPL